MHRRYVVCTQNHPPTLDQGQKTMTTKTLFALMAVVLASACTTTEKMNWVGVGGSKADGNVVLGIDVAPKMGVTETEVEWDVNQANAEAARRCQNWGYADAEVFSEQFPVQKRCFPQGMSPCWSKTYRVFYQCIGEKK